MSPELKQYLTDWYEWATGDAKPNKPFDRSIGLCNNIPEDQWNMRGELLDLLRAEFNDTLYPFGPGSYGDRREYYGKMFMSYTQHECPERLAWVKGKIDAQG